MTEFAPHSEPDPDVTGYLLGTLSADEAAAFAAHLEGCEVCRRELEDLRRVAQLLDAMPPAVALPSTLEAQTFAAIEAAAAEAARAGRREDSAPPTVVVPFATTPSRRRAPRWTSPQLAITAIAAGIVAVACLGIGVKLASTKPTPLAVEQLAAPAGGSARGTATIRATLTGVVIDMDVRGLAPSRPGTIYTCWLVGRGDTLQHQNRVSVGSFVVGRSGTADVQWNTGADLHRFPTIGVTLEPDDGDPLHQGLKVLAAVT
jgi:anti-sigma-K factor RskA